MARRLLSLLAIPLAIAGQLVLASAGTRVYRTFAETGRSPLSDPIPVILVGVACLLLFAAVVTVGFSSLGVLIVGAVSIALGVILIFVRPAQFIGPVRSVDPALASGLDLTAATASWVVTGSILVAGALAARAARRVAGTGVRIACAIGAVVVGVAGVLIGSFGAAGLTRTLGAFTRGPEPGDLALVAVSAVLLALACVTLRWSTGGVAILGALMLVVGIVFMVAPSAILVFSGMFDLQVALGVPAARGETAATGAVLLALALGTRWRRSRRASV